MSFQLGLAKEFFEKEKNLLNSNYPGLNWHRFQQEIGDLLFRSHYHLNLQSESSLVLKDFFSNLKEGIPFEYLSNRSYFYKNEFFVNEDVLIPRSETESLVELACSYLKGREGKNKILDLGTGSGCIALSIAMDCNRPLDIVVSDISEKALEVATINYFRHQFLLPRESTFEAIHSDRFLNIDVGFDLIATNPPYIKEELDRSLVHDQVDQFEPHLALYLKAEKYNQWFLNLFRSSYKALKYDGLFLMEGHENHLSDLAPLAKQSGFGHVKILPDLQGSDRFLQGIKLEK
jgi:release factor glutamine methyltransferase